MNSTARPIVSLLLTAALAGGVAPVSAQNYDQFAPTAGVVGEATKAVVDRVFGVKGEAADIKYHAIELSNHSPVNAGIRSALLPGWGQWFNRQPVKAAALFMAISASAYGAIRTYDRAQDDYDDYRAAGVRNDSTYDDYERRRTQSMVLGGVAITLWAYSVWDAYRNAYNPLWSRERSIELALREDGAAVEWRRRF